MMSEMTKYNFAFIPARPLTDKLMDLILSSRSQLCTTHRRQWWWPLLA